MTNPGFSASDRESLDFCSKRGHHTGYFECLKLTWLWCIWYLSGKSCAHVAWTWLTLRYLCFISRGTRGDNPCQGLTNSMRTCFYLYVCVRPWEGSGEVGWLVG